MNLPERKEIQRYLGYRGAGSETLEGLIDGCMEQLEQVVRPRSVYRTFPVTFTEDEVCIEDMRISSASLRRNMMGCTEAVLFAATLGIETDRLILRSELRSLAEASVLQACAAAWIESYCDEVNERIKEEALARSLYCRPRFSPGYGDVPLQLQRSFSRLLEMPKKIGVSLTESCLMVPAKSVTAFIGLSPVRQNCVLSGCEVCSMKDTCMYSRVEREKE